MLRGESLVALLMLTDHSQAPAAVSLESVTSEQPPPT